MNKHFLLFVAFSILTFGSIAQQTIKLVIHHKLADVDFAMNLGSKNNLGHDFEITRLEYYISGISIIHDNGINTQIPDTWILVNAASLTEVELGNFPINEVEAIHFTVGVDPDHNHLDPASFDPAHPLSPKSPSMHWGWTAGYRFLALEGKGGPQYNQLVQLHGLGDQNYIKTRVNVSATTSNAEVIINLDADYTRALENIPVNAGIKAHSETGQAQEAMENFRNLVFSPSDINTGIRDWNSMNRFQLYPNLTSDGHSIALIQSQDDEDYEIMVTDILGRYVSTLKALQPNSYIDLSVPQSGIYLVRLLQNNKTVSIAKLISE